MRTMLCVLAFGVQTAIAAPPQLKTPAPVIYLAENLDESQQLGWCIDTLGRGFSEQLQTHSCKPQGGDVQFAYEPVTGLVRSVAFPEKCMTLVNAEDVAVPFGLFDCEVDEPTQRFVYYAAELELRLAADPEQCVVAGVTSRSAGPFMSRDLSLQSCSDAAAELKRWIILD